MLKLYWRRVRSRYPWLQIVQTWRFWLVIIFTVVLFIYAVSSIKGRQVTSFEQEIKEVWLGNIEFDFFTGLYFHKEGKNVNLRGLMPDARQLGGLPSHCAMHNTSKFLCALWVSKLILEVENIVEEQGSCQILTWIPQSSDFKPNTCFSMRDFHWYGGSLLHQQTWPLNKADIRLQPYTMHDLETYGGKKNTFGSVLDWFWISASGIAIIVDNSIPVHVSINQTGDKTLCFHSKSVPHSVLKYTICKSENIRKVHRFVIKKFVHLPTSLPKDNYFMSPMWSTNPIYRNSLDQGKLLKYAKDINDNGFESNLIDINENSLSVVKVDLSDNSILDPFDKSKFPNSHQSLMLLRGDYNFELSIAVSPYLPATTQSTDVYNLIQDSEGKAIVIHFQGQDVNVLNLMDDAVSDWYVSEILKLCKRFGVIGVHLVGSISDIYKAKSSFSTVDLMNFERRFISVMSEKTELAVFSSFAQGSQRSSPFIQLQANMSSWSSVGGLKYLIPSVLTLGILGYPFAVPGTVGGPGMFRYINSTYTEQTKPDRELYIRWMGVAAYMPCMMFSYPPWAYDDEVVSIAKEFTKQHKETVAPLVIKAAREFEQIGSPIIRPLWWIDPRDSVSLTIDDEYLIGDTLLVAPIVSKDKAQRDIYIPHGKWKDVMNDREVEGTAWLRDYNIPLDKVATFARVKS